MTSYRSAIVIEGASENNLRDVTVRLPPGMTAVVGVSGSGKSSLAFDTLYHEAHRRLLETLSLGSPWMRMRPARVREIRGLGPAVSLAQNVLNRNPNSTVATAAGIHPFLRVLYARFALRRCPDCGAEVTTTSLEEQLSILRAMTADSNRPVEVVAPLVRRTPGSHGYLLRWLAQRFDAEAIAVDGDRWDGTPLEPDRPHDIAVRVATVRRAADARSLTGSLQAVAALGSPQTVLRTDAAERWLSRVPLCPGCGQPFETAEPEDFRNGTSLSRAYELAGRPIDELLRLNVTDANDAFERLELPAAARPARVQVVRRLHALERVGLGYLALDRPSPSLSRGEAQRLRIALLLANPIEDMLHVLDEPSIGLDPGQVGDLLAQLARLRGPVLMVEHDRAAVAAADHVVELGPGAGAAGGRVVFEGTPATLWRAETESGRWFSGRKRQPATATRPEASDWLAIRHASARNLTGFDVALPIGRLTGVAGPSGAGKTTLVRDVLVASLADGRPIGCTRLDGPRLRPVTVTQEPIGRNARSSAATYSGFADVVRARFSAASGEPSARFSFNRPEGACPDCEGVGAVELKLPYLPSEWRTCEGCDGRRFGAAALATRVRLADGVERTIAEAYELTVDDALRAFDQPAERRVLEPLRAVGLGYLSLGQASPSLSGGEAQRVKLAKWLATARPGDLIVLDEPTTGLHPADLSRLIDVLRGLVESGSTVVVIEHQPDVLRAADWLLRLGPGGGPDGGRLLYAAPPAREETRTPSLRPRAAPRRTPRARPNIAITGATANNLRRITVTIEKSAITGVIGVSGSGKSSLVRDVLEAEATRRFLESLSMYERQSVREGAEPAARRIEGLGPTISVRPERRAVGAVSTVGSASELSFHLAVLLAHASRTGTGPGREPRHFSPSTYEAACLTCHGVGTIAEPQLERLIIRPDLPLCAGAMYSPGYYPQGYLCKPPSLGAEMLNVLAARHGFDPMQTPWNAMTEAAQEAFLNGDEDLDVPTRDGKPRTLHWRGFFRIVAGWDLGGLYTDHVTCPDCRGGRLRPEYLAVRIDSANRHDLHRMPAERLERLLAEHAIATDAPDWVERSRLSALRRLRFLRQVGLGHLHLDRLLRTLSAGEVQRVRLASLLGAGLTGLTALLDEPSRGLHPREVDALADALAELRDAGNTVVLVDHDPRLIERVDRLILLGPGAGNRGGRLVAEGPVTALARSRRRAVRTILNPPPPTRVRGPRRPVRAAMTVRRPTANNLAGEDVEIPIGMLVGLCGVSGSGKSTLAIDIVARALAPARLTTSVAYEDVRPGAHQRIDGAPPRAIHSEQSRTSIQTPGGFLGVIAPLRAAFLASGEATAREVAESDLTPACDACHGRGSIRVDMGFMAALHRRCDACDGTGYRAVARELQVRGRSLPQLSEATLDEVLDRWRDVERVARPLSLANELGLGYLRLGQPAASLSGGEAQRLRLARELARKTVQPTLFILDEPTVGLHASDVERLMEVLDRLVAQGHSVLIVEHDPMVLASCDWLVELGPGGGPDGGRIVATGAPEQVAGGETPTAPYLRAALA